MTRFNFRRTSMIQLEHINLVVSNITDALRFYSAAFPHWRIRSEGDGQWQGKPRKWLHFGDDYTYLTFNSNGEGVNRDLYGHQIGIAHFAFSVKNIDALINRLSLAGFEPSSSGAEHPVRKNIYFNDPEGFEVEFVEYLSDMPRERNSDAVL